jgi:hypothetical protein
MKLVENAQSLLSPTYQSYQSTYLSLPTYHYLSTYLPTYLPLLDQHLLTIAYLPTYLPTYLDLATHLLFTYE